KKMRCFWPICGVISNTYQENHRMLTIGSIPNICKSFFRPYRKDFSKNAWSHFWGLVMAISLATEHTIERLNALLRDHTHRTNDGEFLWRSDWDESWVIREIALDTLKRLHRKGEPIYFIVDDTQTLKRAKKMEAVGKIHHHATGKYGYGHTIVKVCLYYRGVTIPWGSWLYVKKEQTRKLNLPFVKLTELAAKAIDQANLPKGAKVTVLFDAFYLCPKVVNAVIKRGWDYIGVAKSNRWFHCNGHSHQFRNYAPNVLRRSGEWKKIKGLKSQKEYRIAERIGYLNKLGEVKVVFSRRRGDRGPITLVTNDLSRPARKVVADYLRRWSIELLIKDEKQHLGLAAYRVWRYRAVVRYLHLVDAAYACLTHVGLKAQRAQGQKKTKRVLQLPSIRQLKADLQRAVWNETVKNVAKVSHERNVLRRLEKLLAA
ncbi:MAG: transposase, partial [Planctomycetota bacterium]